MKREIEKMRSGERYRFDDKEIDESIKKAQTLCARLRTMSVHDIEYRPLMRELIPGFPDSCTICPPFHCDHGTGVALGEHVFVNYNCTMLDGAFIRIGNNVKIGPDCHFYTPNHPTDYIERRLPQETSLPITVGDDTWIGGNVTVCPGVTIGSRCIIAAGSVVVRDIPDDSLAAGNPAVVKKKVSD